MFELELRCAEHAAMVEGFSSGRSPKLGSCIVGSIDKWTAFLRCAMQLYLLIVDHVTPHPHIVYNKGLTESLTLCQATEYAGVA